MVNIIIVLQRHFKELMHAYVNKDYDDLSLN